MKQIIMFINFYGFISGSYEQLTRDSWDLERCQMRCREEERTHKARAEVSNAVGESR